MYVVCIQAVASVFLMTYRIIAMDVSHSDRINDKRELQKHAWVFSGLPTQQEALFSNIITGNV